ncbi:type II toxin-antitoxin system VapC family toxin [Haloglomus litoreum]|uniref:type II toxin-antitoxin system VapC family toxin n=1 Tax=Haloglomus litoreum TaxID=3034026 RepID=UPI0023E88AE7|nr:PIN domain-containing protein [Haloglomus sp. DT116]
MTRRVLDTTFLIHYWGGDPRAERYLEAHEEEAEFLTTTLNLKEIAVGRQLQGAFDRQEILATFDWLTVVPFDIDHAFVAGELEAVLRRTESPNQDRVNAVLGDLLIAAVARDLDAAVVTENVDDFETFGGVAVESY